MVHEVATELLVQGQRDLAVGVRREPATLGLQFGSGAAIAIQLAIHHASDVTALVDKRLVPVGEADNAQPHMAQQQPVIL